MAPIRCSFAEKAGYFFGGTSLASAAGLSATFLAKCSALGGLNATAKMIAPAKVMHSEHGPNLRPLELAFHRVLLHHHAGHLRADKQADAVRGNGKQRQSRSAEIARRQVIGKLLTANHEKDIGQAVKSLMIVREACFSSGYKQGTELTNRENR